jgi:hypothetical protein
MTWMVLPTKDCKCATCEKLREVIDENGAQVTPCGFLCPTCKGARFTHAMPDGTRGVCFDRPGCTMDRQPCLGVHA